MENNNIKVEKTFSVAVDKLYEAWTDEAALKEWWQPSGRKLKSVNAALHNGGSLQYEFEADESTGNELTVVGKYETVQENKKLVYSWNWKLSNAAVNDSDYKLSIEFKSVPDGSKIIVSQESESDKEGIHPKQDGWDIALKDLKDYLTKNNS